MAERMQQTTMLGAWQDATSAAAARMAALGQACRVLGNDSLRAVMHVVYLRTREGLGDPWRPPRGVMSFADDAWGPRCRRSTIYGLIGTARDNGILRVVELRDAYGHKAGNSYQIDWDGVREVCGEQSADAEPFNARPSAPSTPAAPVAEPSMRASSAPSTSADCGPSMPAANAAEPEPTPSKSWTPTSSVGRLWTPASKSWTPPSKNWTHDDPMSAHAGAGAHVDLILDDEINSFQEKNTLIININSTAPVWQRLPAAADRLVLDLFRHRPACPSMSRRGRVFLASAALLGEAETVLAAWIAEAVEAVQDQRPRNPSAYLHTCMRNGLAAHVRGGGAACEDLLGRVRVAVSRWVAQTRWDPQAVVERERARQRQAARPATPAWSDLSAAEQAAHRDEARAAGTLSELHRRKLSEQEAAR